ncbi:MAG: hypothetical protein KF832_06795 [Caldilineaceae bacterium]|nr:hypothetical protein [Caldilineaceae bacterium]
MKRLNHLHWPLIIGLGALALVRPLLNMTGVMDGLGRPFGPLFVTVLISVAWLAIVVWTRVRKPLLTLICTGLTYGLFAIVISAVLSPLLTGSLSGPITHPWALIAVLITNALWGGLVGVVALAVRPLAGTSAARQ